jgi:hypothetical protein
MTTGRRVDLMEGTGIIQGIFPIISLREAMEEEHHMDRQVAELLLDHICPRSQMNPQMTLLSRWHNVPGSTTI